MERCLSVTEINHFVATILSTNAVLKRVTVEGEISNFKHHSNGHLYFSLKDQQCRIACTMFRSQAEGLKFLPRDGMNVQVRGSISVYEPSGQYQIIAREIEPAGVGNLYAAFEMLKTKLAQKGWFSPMIKKPLPEEIKKVGIVTSSKGAAVHDLIAVIGRRNPKIELLIVPTLVQGIDAPASIISGIEKLNLRGDIDVIIIGRGGGAIEDLWAFNDEGVAEAIYRSHIPVISAVGHETDFTIADFVADLRAPTPSAAGELVAKDQTVDRQQLAQYKIRLRQFMISKTMQAENNLNALRAILKLKSPIQYYTQQWKALSLFRKRLDGSMAQKVQHADNALAVLTTKLSVLDPGYLKSKGYVLVEDMNGAFVKKAEGLSAQTHLKLHFADGIVPVCVEQEE